MAVIAECQVVPARPAVDERAALLEAARAAIEPEIARVLALLGAIAPIPAR